MGEIPVSRVAELRKQLDLTQRQLADMVGVTETTIRNWENNRSGIEWFERIAKLCEALQCTPDKLFEYKSIERGEIDD
jgi:putative transcriptional regulator